MFWEAFTNKKKIFELCDSIRKNLLGLNIVIEDNTDSSIWRFI